ncbi:uncharacterized protein NEMAJ01_0649 [Nematocida major]|uniref:uncharacterized protein n=1 Tax=Nematocida major TaxID=1912982 RepID=UPI0020082F8B|nr:uncharacterized protein NEMAJ01_0649 [Nematocida major]KAH9385753.1 hypothetical protein NEMAJ01_0649 [Nematocida major]
MHAKFYALTIAILTHFAHARVSFNEIIEMQNTEIRNSTAFINPKGPLCLLRGFVYSDLGYMHNKRFFAPEIETDYKLEPAGDVKTTEKHNYTRNAENDKPYPSEEEPALNAGIATTDYAVEYHRTLIEMFPSTGGHTLSLDNSPKDSFFQTLQGMPSKNANYVLAALLLLSEGVDVPIEATEKEVKLEIGSIKVEENICEKAAQVINFFKANPKKEEMPCTLETFSTGEFLNTPQFLIQAYVFEYIKSKDDALDFAACAHAILTSLPENERKDVYSACFVESKAEEDELLQPFVQIQKLIESQRRFPFSNYKLVPGHINLHACKRGQLELLEETFSPNMEPALLALFCFLSYNPEKNEYDVEAMLGEKKDHPEAKALREFFQLESVSPKQCPTVETMQEWNRVVSGLQSKYIEYERNDLNKAWPGLFNALYIIAEITGRRKEEEPTIQNFELMMKSAENGNSEKTLEKIKEYVENLLKSLSVDKSIKTSFSRLFMFEVNDDKDDLYGTITIKYTSSDNLFEHSIQIKFSDSVKLLLSWALLKDESMTFFSAGRCGEPKTFIECLFYKYEDVWRLGGMDPEEEKLEKRIIEIARRLSRIELPGSPNELFLVGHALTHKLAHIASLYLALNTIQVREGNFPPKEHPCMRLTSNLLGSLPLDNLSKQGETVLGIVYTHNARPAFPRISLSDRKYMNVLLVSNQLLSRYLKKLYSN